MAVITRMSAGLIYLLLLPLVDGMVITPPFSLCREWNVSEGLVNLIMETSSIVGTTGSCSCRFSFDRNTTLEISTNDVESPNCDTDIALLNISFTFICTYGEFKEDSFNETFHPKDELWMIVTSNGNSSMSGIVQIKSDDRSLKFQIECYKPNTKLNVSSTGPTTGISTTITSRDPLTRTSTWGLGTNKQIKGDGKSQFPVALIAGCVSGGIVLVLGLVILAVACHRRKLKNPQQNKIENSPRSTTHNDRNTDGEYLSMENELYSSSGDLIYVAFPRQPETSDPYNAVTADNVPVYTCGNQEQIGPSAGGQEGRRTTHCVESPNGDIYTLIDKPRDAKNALNHETAPSGDVYAVVDKTK